MCDFCSELSGRDAGEFARRHPDAVSRVAWASPDLAVLPTLGALCSGHVLIVPRTHFTAFACAPEPTRREAEELVRYLAVRERAEGRDLLWFEHGSARPASSGGCGIAHAHIHVVPVPAGWVRPPLPSDPAFTAAGDGEWLDVPGRGSDYLLIGQLADVWVAPVEWIASQALRRWVAPSVGAVEWDWRTSTPDPDLAETVSALRTILAARARAAELSVA